MRSAFRSNRNSALIGSLAMLAAVVASTSFGGTVGIDLDDNPSNGDESTVETKVLQSFPVRVENVVTNNTTGVSFTFDWSGAGPGGFSSILVAGPDVGTKWEWTTVSQVYSISSAGSFVKEAPGLPVFGGPPGGVVSPGGNSREFALPGKSIFPNQVTASAASLTSSLVTFFSPENTLATCASTFTPGVFTQTVTNTSGGDLVLTVEQEDCCLEPHQIICPDGCQSYLTDVTNCGDCGVTCAFDEFCDAGACAPICPGEGEELCDGECADTLTDVTNCGDCGITCAYDEFCDGGGCADICPGDGQEFCEGGCADTLNDATNCGGCGVTCAFDEFCDGGACAPICPGVGQEYCDGDCVDTLQDPGNCGSCGITCAYDEFCDEGSCEPVCSEGLTLCGTTCVDLENDPLHCGSCENVCGENNVCGEGACTRCRPPRKTACDNECVNTHTDPYNCGGCGNVCDFTNCPSGGQGACSQGNSCICDDSETAGGSVSALISFPPVSTDPSESAVRFSVSQTGRTSTATTPPARPRPSPATPRPVPVKAVVERADQADGNALPPEPPEVSSTGTRRGQTAPRATRRGTVRTTDLDGSKSDAPRVQGATAGTPPVEEAPVCEFQEPIQQIIIPDGETYVQCQTGAVLGTEVFTRARVFRDGKVVGEGPCAVFVPAEGVVVEDFHATTSSIVLRDASGDGLLQPGEQGDLYVSLVNVGPLPLMNPIATLSGPPDSFNPVEVTMISDTAFFPDFPAFDNDGDCENPPPLEPQTALSPFTLVLPEEQEADVGRALRLNITGHNVGPVSFDMPLILGIGEKCDPTDLDGETYDGLEGFLSPMDVDLVPRGTVVNYSETELGVGALIPLQLKLKCGESTLLADEIDPEPRIVSLVHDTLGPLPLALINVDFGPFPISPFFHCGDLQCQFNMNSTRLPAGTFVVGVEMADTRVFEAGFTLLDYGGPGD